MTWNESFVVNINRVKFQVKRVSKQVNFYIELKLSQIESICDFNFTCPT